ncbi:DUF465 domain-containing protein [Henriciella sp. AS95]|uniref:YdcH family protein n=1 Tax=Henriciella sp. AS95 TaxID=3135782 RepID=UPI003171E27A
MSHVPHELAEEFPNHVDRMHVLKQSDPHFARLAEQYHDINRRIHRIETDIEPASDAYQTDLRKKRLFLKDLLVTRLSSEL